MSISYDSNGTRATERIDVPMRAFAGGYYTNLMAMYKHLDIPFKDQKFLFTFSKTGCENSDSALNGNGNRTPNGYIKEKSASRIKKGDEAPYFIHSSNNHRFPPVKPAGQSWLQYLTEVSYLWFVYTYFIVCCFFFPPHQRTFSARSSATSGSTDKTESLREYIKRIHLPQYFVENYLLALISSVTTCPHRTLLDFPASDVTGYKKRVHKQPHYVVQGGVCQIQERLLKGIKIGMGRKVVKVERILGKSAAECGLRLFWEEINLLDTGISSRHRKDFHHVVLAVNPYAVGKIYSALAKQMSRIPCCEAEVVVHYDERVIEDVLDPSEKIVPPPSSLNEKQITPSSLQPSGKLGGLLSRVQQLVGNTDAHVIQLRTSASSTTMVFNNSPSQWTLLNNQGKKSPPSLVTESTHIHPPGVLLTTSSIYPLKQDKVLGSSRFVRVLRTPESRDVVECLFRDKGVRVKKGYVDDGDEKSGAAGDTGSGADRQSGEQEWRNGDDGVCLVGGWCWDGMVLLEGCVRSAVRVARELGVEVPWEVPEGSEC